MDEKQPELELAEEVLAVLQQATMINMVETYRALVAMNLDPVFALRQVVKVVNATAHAAETACNMVEQDPIVQAMESALKKFN